MQNYDVYGLIRSQEIREHFRNTWNMSIKEQVQLVALSYEDILDKIKILRWIAENVDGSEKDKALARDVAGYLEFCYKSVTSPASEAIYLLSWSMAPQRSCKALDFSHYCDDMMEGEPVDAFSSMHISFDELMGYLNEEYGSEEDVPCAEAIVEQINLPVRPNGKNKHNSDWQLFLSWIHGKWVVRRIEADKDWLLAQGFSEDILDMVNYSVHSSMFDHHFTLPFEKGTRLQLQTPIMREPFVGIFDPYHQDFEHRCNDWSCENHLYLCKEDSFPVERSWDRVPKKERVKNYHKTISYHMVNDDDGFSLFDWLERV